MDIGRAFGVLFEDKDWVMKLVLGSVLMLIPIFGQLALLGYGIAIIRNVIADDPNPLPAWENIGDYFVDGLKLALVNLIYAVPLILVGCLFFGVGILPALGGDSDELMVVLMGMTSIVTLCLTCVVILYALFLGLLSPVLHIFYAESGDIGACLRFGEVFRYLSNHIGPIIVSLLVVWAINAFILPIVLVVSLGLLALPTAFWMKTVSCHLYGQISRQAQLTVPGGF
ncbi:MAG TPA: DUF4013 domain-containing protein [Chloroflexi bacterium]|nr:DUF4013 domain-containing protein [Chloroflexota bacterium]